MNIIKPSINESISIFDNEDMIDKAYTGLISIMDLKPKKGEMTEFHQFLGGWDNKTYDQLYALIDGVYIPGSKRDYWIGNFDIGVDELISGSVYIDTKHDETFRYCTITKIEKLPKWIYCTCINPHAIYRVVITTMTKEGSENYKNYGKLLIDESYMIIDKKGRVGSGIDINARKIYCKTGELNNAVHFGAGTLSLLNDRRYLWNVQTKEKVDFGTREQDIIINFGIEAEHIKSLLYARKAPLTPSGRKRPILHWVQQHKRRLEKGIDINIDKYLRGITDFPMGDLNFSITNPHKIKKEKSLQQQAY